MTRLHKEKQTEIKGFLTWLEGYLGTSIEGLKNKTKVKEYWRAGVGLASHLGLVLGVPTIGCAKSILCGQHGDLGDEPGDCVSLLDGDEVVGSALRTKRRVKPVYVSIGHRIDLDEACRWVLACCRGYRLPEPTRLAHQSASVVVG